MLYLLKGLFQDVLPRKEKKAQHRVGIEPTTSLLEGMHSTAVLQPLPKSMMQSYLPKAITTRLI